MDAVMKLVVNKERNLAEEIAGKRLRRKSKRKKTPKCRLQRKKKSKFRLLRNKKRKHLKRLVTYLTLIILHLCHLRKNQLTFSVKKENF